MTDYFQLTLAVFNKNERVRNKSFCAIPSARTYVDGCKLTELQMDAILYNQKDVDDLIEVLRIAKYAFHNQEIENGKHIECAIRVGMVIRCTTNKNWDRRGHSAMVTAFSIPDDKVWLGQQVISIKGFLENIETGRYEVVEP